MLPARMCFVFIPALSLWEQYYIKNHLHFMCSVYLIVLLQGVVICLFCVGHFNYNLLYSGIARFLALVRNHKGHPWQKYELSITQQLFIAFLHICIIVSNLLGTEEYISRLTLSHQICCAFNSAGGGCCITCNPELCPWCCVCFYVWECDSSNCLQSTSVLNTKFLFVQLWLLRKWIGWIN